MKIGSEVPTKSFQNANKIMLHLFCHKFKYCKYDLHKKTIKKLVKPLFNSYIFVTFDILNIERFNTAPKYKMSTVYTICCKIRKIQLW